MTSQCHREFSHDKQILFIIAFVFITCLSIKLELAADYAKKRLCTDTHEFELVRITNARQGMPVLRAWAIYGSENKVKL